MLSPRERLEEVAKRVWGVDKVDIFSRAYDGRDVAVVEARDDGAYHGENANDVTEDAAFTRLAWKLLRNLDERAIALEARAREAQQAADALRSIYYDVYPLLHETIEDKKEPM